MKSDTATFRQQAIPWITATMREAAWAPLSVFGFYLLGLAIDLYDIYPFMDIPTHFMGGVAITYFYRSAIYNAQKFLGDIPLPIQVLLGLTSTGTTAVLWEFYENIFDTLFGTDMVRGLEDTIMDLFLGISGALLLSIFYHRRKQL